jgi:transketolase
MTRLISNTDKLEWRCVNTIRTLAVDTVQKANSGHPGILFG